MWVVRGVGPSPADGRGKGLEALSLSPSHFVMEVTPVLPTLLILGDTVTLAQVNRLENEVSAWAAASRHPGAPVSAADSLAAWPNWLLFISTTDSRKKAEG